jgi:hypothetical protein
MLFPQSDENFCTQPFEATDAYDERDQCSISLHSRGSKRWQNNINVERIGSRMLHARSATPGYGDTAAVSGTREEKRTVRGLARFQRLKEDRMCSISSLYFSSETHTFIGGQEGDLTSFTLDQQSSLLDSNLPFIPKTWSSHDRQADLDFHLPTTSASSPSGEQGFHRGQPPSTAEEYQNGRPSGDDFVLTQDMSDVSDPSIVASPPGIMKRFQKRKKSSPSQGVHLFMRQSKIRRSLPESDDQSPLRNGEEPFVPTCSFIDHPFNLQDSPRNCYWNSSKRDYYENASSQSYLRFCNEGKEVDLSGQPVNFRSSLLEPQPKEPAQNTPDRHRESSFPDFLF